MKHIRFVILTILMLAYHTPFCASAMDLPAREPGLMLVSALAQTTYADEELARAVALGFGEYRADNPAITYPEFFAMLDRALELIDNTRLSEWQAMLPEARAAAHEISRSNAMCAVFSLAELLGGDYWRYNSGDSVHWDAKAPWEMNEWILDDYWGDTMRFPMGFNGQMEPDGTNFGGTAYFYSMGYASISSGKSIFDFDQAQQSMRCADMLTYQEALLAALRFSESTSASANDQFLLSASNEAQTTTYADEELASALEQGFGEYRADNPAITYPEFFAMLDRALELIDNTRLSEWQAMLPEARAAAHEISRSNAMCAVFSLAELLGGDYWRYNSVNSVHWDAKAPWDMNEWVLDDYWGDTMRFPMGFNGQMEPDSTNFGGTAYFYSMGYASIRSGKSIFDFDQTQQSMRCADMLTYQEALLAALRFSESTSARVIDLFFRSDSIEARTAVLAADTLTIANAMPDASWNSLPAWYGVTLTNTAETGAPMVRQNWFIEQDLIDIASFGFNFIRVPLEASLYFSGENQSLVNKKRLANMDALIDWGAANGVHICFDVHNCDGLTTDAINTNDTLWTDETQQEQFVQIWDLLSERYKDVPNSLLSFNLLNEPNYIDTQTYVTLMRRAIEAIRVHSPERLIFVDMNDFSATPIYELTGDRVAQSFHFYEPSNLTHAFRNYSDDKNVAASWPMYECKLTLGRKGENLSIKGSFSAGTSINFGVSAIHLSGELHLMADGQEVFSHTFGNPAVGQENCIAIYEEGTDGEFRDYEGKHFTAILPDDAEKLEFTLSGNSQWINLNLIVLNIIGEKQIVIGARFDDKLLPAGKNMTDMPNPQLVIAQDGTVSCNNDVFFTLYDEAYLKNQLARYRAFSEETGVAVMLQEFAVERATPYAPTLAYLEDLLSAANEYNLNWCGWDYFGRFNFLATQESELREGATYQDLHGDGQAALEMLAILQKHMMQ